ncbi:MAG TPA: hypothetical protein VIJ20_05265 [Solirubrobacteraceae bacterium]
MWFLRQGHHRRQAVAARPISSTPADPPALTLRVATADDLPRIARLAALDSAWPPEPPVLTAELDGAICVAVSLVDLRTVADPFRLTAEVRAITLARARQLLGAAPRRDRRPRRFAARPSTADRSARMQNAT